jgi:hypothetical protein
VLRVERDGQEAVYFVKPVGWQQSCETGDKQ